MRTGRLAKIEGVSPITIARWVREGHYKKTRVTKGGHYRIWMEQEPKVILYTRVSTGKQKSSLDYQEEALLREFKGEKVVKDIGSGFNFDRRGFKAILERSLNGVPQIVVATTQDRITRTGFGLIKKIIELSGGEIRLLEEDVKETEEFDVTSFIAFITSFVSSSYGKRSAAKRKKRKGDNGKDKDLP